MSKLHPISLTVLAMLAGGCPGLLPAGSGTDSDATTTTTTTTAVDPTTSTTVPGLTTPFDLECYPGTLRCSPSNSKILETCKDTGLAWEPTECSENETCVDGGNEPAACVGPCQLISDQSSQGCEFVAIRMNSFNYDDGDQDVMVVGNTDPTHDAQVQLYFTPNNSVTEELAHPDPILLAPGESHLFNLTNDPLSGYTNLRTGGVYRVEADIPVTAYLHSALENSASNDSSMLLPLATLRQDYVIASYPGFVDAKEPDKYNGRPSYFNVIALEDGTNVEWVSPADTAAQGVLVEAVPAGETGKIALNRFDVLQVGSSALGDMLFTEHDLSGTVVSADKPIWVMGATECAFVPWGVGYCNHLQEQMIPLEYWGKKYIGPHSPARADESHIWRVYAGKDNVQVTVETTDVEFPVQPIILVKRGDWKEIEVPHGVSLIFTATGPILPVQYLVGGNNAGEIGDPAMYQMIAVEQWLNRYVVVTGVDYDLNYAQIMRRKDGADVTINGEVVTGYYLINGTGQDNRWEVADHPLGKITEPTTYVVESADEFNVVVLGYNVTEMGEMTNQSAYAYPGGMNLKKIYDP